jgi:hypothetical protein
MDQPAHSRTAELSILRVDRRIVPQHFLHHDRIAMERGPMQRRNAVLGQRCDRKSAAEHRADGQKVVVPGGVCEMQSLFRCTRHKLRIGRKDRVGACIVAAPERVRQSIKGTCSLEQ